MMQRHLSQHIIPFLGAERDIRAIEESDLEQYKVYRGRHVLAQTISKELSTLRQLLRYGADVYKLFERAPTTRNPKCPKYQPAWRLLTPEEVTSLLEALTKMRGRGKEALPYFLLIANTGMRGGEATSIRWEMLEPRDIALNLPPELTKTKRPRRVPLNQVAREAIALMRRMRSADRLVGRVFSAKTHYGSWRKACRQVGVKARVHDLRHTFGSLLHAAGRSGPEIRDILGHATLTMANLYAHTYQPALEEAVEAVQLSTVPKNVPLLGQNVPVSARNGGSSKIGPN